jgi:excisionase family DNA binding protein
MSVWQQQTRVIRERGIVMNMERPSDNWAKELIHQDRYTPGELADLLNVSEAFIYQEVAKRRLRARKVGDDTVDIPRDAVLEWMDKRNKGDEHI